MTAPREVQQSREPIQFEVAGRPPTVYIVDYDLPANNSRRRFYRRVKRYLKAQGHSNTAEWSTQSVVITTDRSFAEFVYQEASQLGHAHMYKAEKIK